VTEAMDDDPGAGVDLQPRHFLAGTATPADGRRRRQLGSEELEQEPADRVAVESQVLDVHSGASHLSLRNARS